MNGKMFCILALSSVMFTAGCNKDETQDERLRAVISKTVEGEEIDWRGGEYEIEVDYAPVTRAATMIPWSYRITVDGVAGETIDVKEDIRSVKVSVPANYTERRITYAVEVKIPLSDDDDPAWENVFDAVQQSGLVELEGTYWATSNLTVSDGKFAIGEKPEETGYYFKHMSTYGVSSEGSSYGGTAYAPEATAIALADIPERNGDPCVLASGGALRMPTYGEMAILDLGEALLSEVNGVPGLHFGNKTLFLPFSGYCNEETGELAGKTLNAGYWTSGHDGEMNGILFQIDPDYRYIVPKLGVSMVSVRCVRNLPKAVYVSHTPEQLTDNGAFTATIRTTPGNCLSYPVELMEGMFPISVFVKASDGGTATIEVPVNDSPDEIVFEIFVDGEPTGRRIVQPGKKDYAEYRSHTPTGTVPADAFTLTVRCESDMASFDVEVRSGSETVVKQTGSKEKQSVELAVPANEGGERVLEIWVNGVDTGKKLTQEKGKKGIAQLWSPGYLTVKNGAYTFADKQERGMYFKYNSRYGIVLNGVPSSSAKYQEAYGPEKVEATEMPYAQIPCEEVDPCMLVADGNSWRMPTYDEWLNLFDAETELSVGTYRMFFDADQQVYLTPSGQLKNTGSGVQLPAVVRAWSSTPATTGKYRTVTYSLTATANASKADVAPDVAIMVRCVRDK